MSERFPDTVSRQSLKVDRRTALRAMFVATAGLAVASCTNVGAERGPKAEGLRDPATRDRAERVTVSFENGNNRNDTAPRYDFAQNLGDGRGITMGRAGFTTGTYDALEVVRTYSARSNFQPTPLSPYLPALESVTGGDSTEGLDGFAEAWRYTAQTDPNFRQSQDDVYSRLYFDPAMVRAGEQGVRTAAGQLILLDSIVQHGNGEDPDGLPAMLAQTNETYGPLAGRDEVSWLRDFMDVRREHLINPVNTATQAEWADSAPRVDTLESFIDRGQLDLPAPLEWEAFGNAYRVEE